MNRKKTVPLIIVSILLILTGCNQQSTFMSRLESTAQQTAIDYDAEVEVRKEDDTYIIEATIQCATTYALIELILEGDEASLRYWQSKMNNLKEVYQNLSDYSGENVKIILNNYYNNGPVYIVRNGEVIFDIVEYKLKENE
jgi:outer membrane lipoprotein-sorting protein